MSEISQSLRANASLLRANASRHSITGVLIATFAVVIATALSSFMAEGNLELDSLLSAQRTNPVLWILNFMPFVFAYWGQYVSHSLSYEASAMLLDQTSELQAHTKALEKKAEHEATHDLVTGLPNRMLFVDRLQQAAASARRETKEFAVLLLDIDRFKEVNDTMGHYSGDRLLKQVALRLSSVMRESDTVARIGGDEFGFILLNSGCTADLELLAERIRRSLSPRFVIENLSLDVQVSMGAVVYPKHGRDADTLIQRADVAMYAAKRRTADFALYTEEMDEHSPHRLTLSGELRDAIERGELRLHFQPKINCASGALCGAEALTRWQHKKHGMMPPDEFIGLAERTGLINGLTLWVLKRALEQCALWHDAGLKIGVAVNISSRCLLDLDFPDILTGLLASHDLPAEYLKMEITETSIMVDPDRALAILDRIRAIGVGLSIDDFGTGYSSLAYLKRLPVSELKIDKSFVLDMLSNDSDSTIVRATIQLGHALGLSVVAEGVEDEQTSAELRRIGCDVLQGYLISRPLDQENFLEWAKERVRAERQASPRQDASSPVVATGPEITAIATIRT